jgi:DNA-binding XRE family transcriptional regulator
MEKVYSITVNLQGIEFSTIQTGLADMAAAAVAASRATEFNILPRPFEKEIYDLISHFEKNNEPYSFSPAITIREITPKKPTTKIPGNIREELKKARLSRQLTVESLSNLSGVSMSAIFNIEEGRQIPRALTVEKIMSDFEKYDMTELKNKT